MLLRSETYQFLSNTQICAGMRGAFPPDYALRLAETLIKNGIVIFEFTMNSEQPIEAMKAVKAEFGKDVCVGMGTVLDTPTAERVLEADADFVVSPAFQPEIVAIVTQSNCLMAPGIATPSEAVQAWAMGVDILKLFPIGTLGVDHFKAIYGPLNHMKFMCNGGMNGDNAAQFIEAGAIAVGMANWLTGDGSWSMEQIGERAKSLRSKIDLVIENKNNSD